MIEAPWWLVAATHGIVALAFLVVGFVVGTLFSFVDDLEGEDTKVACELDGDDDDDAGCA